MHKFCYIATYDTHLSHTIKFACYKNLQSGTRIQGFSPEYKLHYSQYGSQVINSFFVKNGSLLLLIWPPV